jgi:hypothetical protein
VAGGAGELVDVLARGGERVGRWPALQQLEEHRRAQVTIGDVDRGGVDGEQVGPRPVADPPLIAASALVEAPKALPGSSR